MGEADRLRAQADLLLAHLDWAEPGDASVVLPDFDGGEMEVALDPALRPHENAERLYDEARRRARAEARLPGLLEAAEKELERWSGAVAALERGETPEWVEGALRRGDAKERRTAPQPGERAAVSPLPHLRRAGGARGPVVQGQRPADVRARGARGRVAARAVGPRLARRAALGGARARPRRATWRRPPSLAALYSKARTSGTVAVDWTRRKYVRKPRGAPPGRVTLIHAKTIFVEPDPAVEERLRAAAERD